MALQAQAQPTRQPASASPEIGKLPIEERIKLVVENGAPRLPASAGRQLLTLIQPKSLVVVAGVLGVWAGAQFFGIGELADVVLLIGGWAMFGAVAIQAARVLYECGALIVRAKDKADIDQAGKLLARAVTLIGVQGTLAILMDKPAGAFKDQFFVSERNPTPFAWSTFKDLPRNHLWGYLPKTEGVLDARMDAGVGGTNVYTGDIQYSLKGTDIDRQLALAHEQVHQLLTPKLFVFRRLRTFMRAQGYNRSYVLRYLEEAIAETNAQLRVKGFSKANIINGIRFPMGDYYTNRPNA